MAVSRVLPVVRARYLTEEGAIKIESGLIVLMSIFVVASFIPIGVFTAWCCGRNSTTDDLNNSVDSLMALDESSKNALIYKRRASVVTILFFFFVLTISDLCIFHANNRLSSTVEMTPELIKSTVHDIHVFLKDTHLKIKYKLDNGYHTAIEKVIKDLEDIDILLGEPIRIELSANTGIELAFDSLKGISIANNELSSRVLMLQETVARGLKVSKEASARMEELQIQLSVLQRQCTFRDRPLCDTLRIRSFEENGIIEALKTRFCDRTETASSLKKAEPFVRNECKVL